MDDEKIFKMDDEEILEFFKLPSEFTADVKGLMNDVWQEYEEINEEVEEELEHLGGKFLPESYIKLLAQVAVNSWNAEYKRKYVAVVNYLYKKYTDMSEYVTF